MTGTDPQTLLAPHLAAARQLIVSAGMVGDADDFDVWRWRCRDWTTGVSSALKYLYGDQAAGALQRLVGTGALHSSWQESLRAELDRLAGNVAMLDDLLREPRSDAAGEQRPAGVPLASLSA